MAMSNELELATLRMQFGNVIDASSVYDDIGSGFAATSTAGSLYLSLHTGPVGEAGAQTTNEITTGEYEGYLREAIPRTLGLGDDWTVAANAVSNTDDILFPTATGGSTGATITHWAIGTDATGAGHVLYYGAFTTAPVLFAAINEAVSDDILYCIGHGLVGSDPVLVSTALGGTLPSGLVEGTIYYAMSTGSVNTVALTAVAGSGSAIEISSHGAGRVAKLTSLAIAPSGGTQPKITAGTLQIRLN